MLIQTPHSSKNSFDALQPSLSTIWVISTFKDRRFVVHEPFQSQIILPTSPGLLCYTIYNPTHSLLSHGVSHQL
ncbi:hypothetical protein A2U01_0091456, partial [Trifolium medium]|nr:hypothetical protein [Trifolium medium]